MHDPSRRPSDLLESWSQLIPLTFLAKFIGLRMLASMFSYPPLVCSPGVFPSDTKCKHIPDFLSPQRECTNDANGNEDGGISPRPKLSVQNHLPHRHRIYSLLTLTEYVTVPVLCRFGLGYLQWLSRQPFRQNPRSYN